MKQKISITIEEKLAEQLEKALEDSTFRNKSHLIELAVQKFMEERENGI
jgi:metal-responsive CopG/Arc/MetJ family transcriptional regulator